MTDVAILKTIFVYAAFDLPLSLPFMTGDSQLC